MRFEEDGIKKLSFLESGDIFYAPIGTEYVAHPQREARILVVEAQGSV